MSINVAIAGLIRAITPYIRAGALLVAFIAVIKTGFEVMLNRKDEDKRKDALKSLIYVGIGILVVVGAVEITRILVTSADTIANVVQNQ